MATVDKNFKVKHGLIVEGTTATVNGEDVITTGSTTDDLNEGSSNLYYTTARAKGDAADLLVNATLTNITITGNEDGLTITAENGVADSDTDDLTEGVTNLYFTDERAQDAVGNAVGTGLSYNDTTGAISVTADTYDAFGAASTVAGDLTTHISDTSTHGVTGDIVGTSDTQTLSNKTISGGLNIQDAGTIFEDSSLVIQSFSTYPILIQGDQSVEIKSMNSDIILNADGSIYKNSNSAGNELVTQNVVNNFIGDNTVDGSTGNTITDRITTAAAGALTDAQSYADGLVQGLNVKNSVRAASAANVMDYNSPGSIGGVTLADGDRVLLKNQSLSSANGIYIYDVAHSPKLYLEETVEKGDYVLVTDGTYAATGWVASSADSMNVTWTQFSAANEYTASTGITITGNAISVTADTYDAFGAASTAETNAKDYADETFVTLTSLPGQLDDYVPTSEKGQALGVATLDASGYVPSSQLNIDVSGDITTAINALTTDDIEEGSENLYFTDERAIDAVSAADIYPNAVIVNNVSKTVANTQSVSTASTVSGITWAKASYKSAKLVVKAATATNSQVSEIMVTLDSSDNIAITEFGIVYTDAELATVTADVSGTDVRIRVTTLNASTDVTVVGTLLL